MSAAEDWADALASWAIPPEIMASAPEDPWAWPVTAFAIAAILLLQTPAAARAWPRLRGSPSRGGAPRGGGDTLARP